MALTDSFRLDGKVALVTGASRGIGEGVALAFAEAGADLVLVARTAADLEQVAGKVRSLGREALAISGDVGDPDAPQTITRLAVERFGHVDVLFNGAGINRRVSVLEATPADWDAVIGLNLRGVYFLCQAVGKLMAERRQGKIVNVASMTSFRGFADLSPYSISKTAIAALTRNLALEWAEYNIQVNAVAPGWIETPMTAGMTQARRQWVVDHTPQGRFGVPRDVALLALYLASPASDFMTGQVLPIDGGFLAGHPWPALKA